MKGIIANFADRMRYAMKVEQITQQKLSDLTSVKRSHISRYLNGHANPKLNKIDMFARILNVSPAWLMGYDVPMREVDFKASLTINGINNMYLEFSRKIQELDLNEDDLKTLYNFCINLKMNKA